MQHDLFHDVHIPARHRTQPGRLPQPSRVEAGALLILASVAEDNTCMCGWVRGETHEEDCPALGLEKYLRAARRYFIRAGLRQQTPQKGHQP